MNVNDTTVYGWIKLEFSTVNSYGRLIIKEYALSKLFEPTAVHDITNNQKINLYPNPVGTTLNILLPDEKNSVDISILDIRGKIHFTQKTTNSGVIIINTEDLKSGLYIVKVTSDWKTYNSKIIKK